MTRRQRLGCRLSQPMSFGAGLAALVVIIALAVLVAILWERLDTSTHAGCQVQAKALPANHRLADEQQRIYNLIGPAVADGRTPPLLPGVSGYVVQQLQDIAADAQFYANAEAGLPETRTC